MVTGASRGIGRAIALRLAREGAAVAVNYYHRATEAENVVALIHQQSGRALAVQADVGDAAQVRAVAERILASLAPSTSSSTMPACWPRAAWRISTTPKWKLCAVPTWTAWFT